MRIFLSGYYAFGNLGDQALLWTLLRAFESQGQHEYVIATQRDALPSELRPRVTSVTIRSAELRRAAATSDVTVFGGGSQFQDYGVFRNNRHLLRQLVLAASARQCAGLGLSIGPLQTATGRLLGRAALGLMNPLLVRDRESQEFLRSAGNAVMRSEDIVFARYLKVPQIQVHVGTKIGFSLMPFIRLSGRSGSDERWLAAVGAGVGTFARSAKATFVGLPFQVGADADAIDAAFGAVHEESKTSVSFADGPEGALQRINECSHLVAVRFHALVFAAMLRKPILIIPYHPKVRHLAAELGYGAEAILELEELHCAQTVARRLAALVEHPERFLPRQDVAEIELHARSTLDSAVRQIVSGRWRN